MFSSPNPQRFSNFFLLKYSSDGSSVDPMIYPFLLSQSIHQLYRLSSIE